MIQNYNLIVSSPNLNKILVQFQAKREILRLLIKTLKHLTGVQMFKALINLLIFMAKFTTLQLLQLLHNKSNNKYNLNKIKQKSMKKLLY